MNAFIYSRKSTDDSRHQVLSIEAQDFGNDKIIGAEKLCLRDRFEESRSAKIPGRPLFKEMMRRIEQGEAQAIVCWKLDRLARNFLDGGAVIMLLQTGVIQRIYTHDRVYTPADNVLLLAVEFGMATQYVRDLSANVTRGMEQKVRNGVLPCLPPVGYVNNARTRLIDVEHPKGRLVTRTFEKFDRGQHSLLSLWKEMTALGLLNRKERPFPRTFFGKLLRNPFYYGTIRYKGRLYPGKHQPLISKELFDRVQQKLRRPTYPQPYGTKPFPYRGFFRCSECLCLITMEEQKGITYLRCTKKRGFCSQRYTQLARVHEQMLSLLRSIVADQRLLASLETAVRERAAHAANEQRSHNRALVEQRTLLEEEQAQLLTFLTRGVIREEQYTSRANELYTSLQDISEAIAKNSSQDPLEPEKSLLEALNRAISLSRNPQVKETRDFLGDLGSNWRIDNSVVCVDLKKRWATWLDWKNRLPEEFWKSPLGYQRAVMWSFLDAVRSEQPAATKAPPGLLAKPMSDTSTLPAPFPSSGGPSSSLRGSAKAA
jgi:site-specific DNA recombinase